MANDPIFLPKYKVTPHPFSQSPKAPKRVFFAAMIFIFGLLFVAASYAGFVPDYVDGSDIELALSELPQLGNSASSRAESQSAIVAAVPERIEIPAIGMDLAVQNPATRDVDELAQVLVSGPARYVDSARLGERGNMIIFGHSSRLPVVRNQMYKAFNNISELKAGDVITVSGNGNEYLYVVTTVRIANAEEDVVSLSKDSTRLTLVTCNVLGEKTSRFIVEADFVGVLPPGN